MRYLLRVFVSIAVVLAETSTVGGDLPPPPEKLPSDPQELEIFQKIHAPQISDTHWTNVDVEVALKELTAKSKAVDPKHVGIKFALQFDSNRPKTSIIGYRTQRNIKNILLLDETSIAEILGYITAQTNLPYKITRDGVIFFAVTR